MKLPPPPSSLPPRPDLVDRKRKRDQRGPEVVEEGKGPFPKEAELQRGAKQAKVAQTLVDKKAESQIGVPAWTPALVLDKAPLPTDASIRNVQQGKAEYMADVVKQALILPEDMADLRSLRKHEVFLSLKRDLISVFPNLLTFSSLKGCPIHTPG